MYNETGPQPIQLTEIIAFLNEKNISDREERREVTQLIRALDAKLLQLTHAKLQRERDRLLKTNGSGNVRKR